MCADRCEKDLHTADPPDSMSHNALVSSVINNTFMLDLGRHPKVIQKEPVKDVRVWHLELELQTDSAKVNT